MPTLYVSDLKSITQGVWRSINSCVEEQTSDAVTLNQKFCTTYILKTII